MKAGIFLLLMWPGLCAAQADAPVAKPEVKAGDRWTYRRMNYERNQAQDTYEVHVTFAARDAIHAVITEKDGRESDATYTSEWNEVVAPRGRVNVRDKGELQFPLRTGATYAIEWTLEEPRRQMGSGRHKRNVKVVGWEEVTVPAGRFRALKVQSEGNFWPFGSGYVGTVRDVFWYVPEVKRWVKHVHDSFRPGNRISITEHSGEELVEFRIQ